MGKLEGNLALITGVGGGLESYIVPRAQRYGRIPLHLESPINA